MSLPPLHGSMVPAFDPPGLSSTPLGPPLSLGNSSHGYPYETPLGQLDCAVASIATMKGLDGGFPVLFTEDPFGQRSKLTLRFIIKAVQQLKALVGKVGNRNVNRQLIPML